MSTDYDDAESLVKIGAILFVPLIFIPLFIILFRLLKRVWRNTKDWQERDKHGLEYIEKSLSTSIFHYVMRAERKHQMADTTFHSKNWREVSEIQHSSAFLSASWVSNYMNSSLVGYIWMIFQVVVNLVAVATYIGELQLGFNPLWLVGIEYFVTICFTIDYLIFFYAAADKLRYFFSAFALFDLFTILPVYASILFVSATGLNPLRVLRAVRVVRVVHLFSRSDTQRQYMMVFFTILCLFFVGASLIQAVEGLTFLDSIYFIIVTFTTVGYGDITPHTLYGKVAVSALIVIGFLSLTYQTGNLISAISKQSPYELSYHTSGEVGKHVVVLGEITPECLREFLREFFHERHHLGFHIQHKVVILQKSEPSYEIEQIMKYPLFAQNIQYVLGSEMNDRDLSRAKVKFAAAVFVFTNRHSANPEKQDFETTMRCLAIKAHAPYQKIYTQFIKQQSRENEANLPANIQQLQIEKFLMNSMALSCVMPGFSTLLSNLIQSCSEGFLVTESQHEYYHGMCQEIHFIEFGRSFSGKSFHQAALTLYRKHEIILIAVEERDTQKITLNPGKVLREGDIGFFLSLSEGIRAKLKDDEGEVVHELDLPLLAHGSVNLMDAEPLLMNSDKEDSEVEDATVFTQKCPDLKDCVLKKVTFSDHIIVVAPVLGYHLIDFIRPLRRKKMAHVVKIVILCHALPDDSLWESLGIFPDIYFVQGTAPKDIPKLYPVHARQIVVLADSVNEEKIPEFADAPAVAVIRGIQPKLANMSLIEIIHETSIKFFPSHDPNLPILQQKWWQQEKKLGMHDVKTDYRFDNVFAAGKALFSNSLLSSLLAEMFYRPYLLEIFNLMMNTTEEDGSVLTQIPVPANQIGKPFSELFAYMLEYGVVPIALYRNGGENVLSYVYTTPKRQAEILASDLIFVLVKNSLVAKCANGTMFK